MKKSELKEATSTNTKDFDAWATELHIPSWQLSAAIAVNKWANGKQLTEAQFRDGLKNGLNRPIGG